MLSGWFAPWTALVESPGRGEDADGTINAACAESDIVDCRMLMEEADTESFLDLSQAGDVDGAIRFLQRQPELASYLG